MTPQEKERLAFLQQGACTPLQYIKDYYGLTWPFEGDLEHDFKIWRKSLQRPKDCEPDSVSRYEIEAFMNQKHVVPTKWMAAMLGMQEHSFQQFADQLENLGLRPKRYLPYENMASRELIEDVVPALRDLRFRTFSDHNSFCTRLHADIAAELELTIEPLYCETSIRLEDHERQFAKYFDCITLEPLSVAHLMWLDFRKPLTLGPDRCSKLFYVENRDDLRGYCAGAGEPDELCIYEKVLEGVANGGA